MADDNVYCVCGQPYNADQFMIQCDVCKDWFHGSCVNVKEYEAGDIEKYHCPHCQLTFGPPVWKMRMNWHRHDYCDPEAQGKAVQTGTTVFVNELKLRHFPSADDVILKLQGHQLTLPYLLQNGFTCPILVENQDGLGLVIPPYDLTVSDVMDFVGPDFLVDVIDVGKQEDLKMTMAEWAEYYNSYNRTKIYNVISLEFSDTRLSDFVKPPTIVQQMSWVENCWPSHVPKIGSNDRPAVMKYCLMGTENSYTDFHIDFGGSSVWYHVLKGEKIFYLIKPTQANLALYEHWMVSANQSETFFGDQVDTCHRLALTSGQTLFIPTGWIHAVLTSVDSMVFGGNFLHSFNIALQLQIHDLENRIETPDKYKFPSFETTVWFAASYVVEQLKSLTSSEIKPPLFLVSGAKALVTAIKEWFQESKHAKAKSESIPSSINVPKLLKDLAKEVRSAEKRVSGRIKVEKPPKKPKASPAKSSKNATSKTSSSAAVSVKGSGNIFQSEEIKIKLPAQTLSSEKESKNEWQSKYSGHPKSKLLNRSTPNVEEKPSPPKNESIYDFNDSDDDNLIVDENPTSRRPYQSSYRQRAVAVPAVPSTTSLPPISTFTNIPVANFAAAAAAAAAGATVPGSSAMTDNDLVTNEIKDTPLKLRFSFNGKPFNEPQPPKEATASNKDEPSQDDLSDARKNGTIDDLLLASNFALETDSSRVSLEEELSGGRASPSTRDAIQGMLSMSKSAFTFSSSQGSASSAQTAGILRDGPLSSGLALAPGKSNLTLKAKLQSSNARLNRPRKFRDDDDEDEDFEESLKKCHQDGEFIYLGLEASDDELHVFKPRGKSKRDEAWNPKAKLVPNCPKPPRPVREGTKKEAIETGLAAAAAKLANQPPPKRPYNRKKPLTSKVKEEVSEPGPSTTNAKKPISMDLFRLKKPKKGFATAKQRLGKILKIHKMLY